MQENNIKIDQIVNDVKDINKMFIQIEEMVNDQGIKIDDITKNVICANKDVKLGNK